MSSPWRVRIRRADGTQCNHPSSDPCPLCAADRADSVRSPRALQAPRAFSFYLSAEDLADRVFAPWETPHAIESRSQLLQFCEARGLDSRYLKESIVHPHRKPREI